MSLTTVTSLPEEQQGRLERFLTTELAKFDQCTGRTHLITHEIRLKEGTVPIKQRYYPRNPKMQEVIDTEVDKMLAAGVIEPSTSAWSSPVVLIKKPSGSYRFCIDFRRVNACTERDAYPLPRINAILSKLRKARYISTLDLANGYWQVPLAPESRPLTSFTVPGRGLFQFTCTPFGLHSAGSTFQRLLDRVIGPELEPRVFAYLDDVIITSSTLGEHLDLLKEVLGRLREANLRLNPDKCHFCRSEMKYLGHVVNAEGVGTDPEKVQAIVAFPRPHSVKAVRSFLGMASWYRGYIPRFAKISAPLTMLLKKNQRWAWTEKQEGAFNLLKGKLTEAPILSCPDYQLPFTLQVDASDEGLGAALTQTENGKEHVVEYASRLLSTTEQKFTTTEKECLALVWAVRKFRPYLEGYHFVAETDHSALKWLLKLKEPTGRLARWVLELQQHDFEVKYRKGAANKVADALSRYPAGEAEDSELETAVCPVEAGEDGKEDDDENDVAEDAVVNPRRDRGGVPWPEAILRKVQAHPSKDGKYVIHGEKLFMRVRPNKTRGTDSGTHWRWCVPVNQREGVLRETHDAPTAGHFGYRKTARALAREYYWPGWRGQLRRYIQGCQTCQRYKVAQAKPAGMMHFRVPIGPWHTVSADLMGPLPLSKKRNRFIVAFQDSFSKWTEMAPLRDATAVKVAEKFRELVLLRHGAPEVLLVDNGVQWVAKVFKEVADDWEVKVQYTAPYSPQSNPIERRNRVLKTLIAQSIQGSHQKWDERLAEITFAVNTSAHDSTDMSPALLCYGRELRTPRSLSGPAFEEADVAESDVGHAHSRRMDNFKKLYDLAKKNLRKAFDRQARFYNLRRRDVTYAPGQMVWRRSHVLSSAADAVSGKLAPKFDGPFRIIKKRGYNLYVLSDPTSDKTSVSHVKDLKPWFPPELSAVGGDARR